MWDASRRLYQTSQSSANRLLPTQCEAVQIAVRNRDIYRPIRDDRRTIDCVANAHLAARNGEVVRKLLRSRRYVIGYQVATLRRDVQDAIGDGGRRDNRPNRLLVE